MAELMKTSRAQVDRLLDPDNGSATIESLQRASGQRIGRIRKGAACDRCSFPRPAKAWRSTHSTTAWRRSGGFGNDADAAKAGHAFIKKTLGPSDFIVDAETIGSPVSRPAGRWPLFQGSDRLIMSTARSSRWTTLHSA
jgi:hypothetical protein